MERLALLDNSLMCDAGMSNSHIVLLTTSGLQFNYTPDTDKQRPHIILRACLRHMWPRPQSQKLCLLKFHELFALGAATLSRYGMEFPQPKNWAGNSSDCTRIFFDNRNIV